MHNCAGNGCKPSNTRQVVQERLTVSNKFEDELNHPTQPDDCFLNLAQLRSAVHVQQFRSPRASRPDSALTDVIESAILNKRRLEREARDVQMEKDAEKTKKAEERHAKAAQKEAQKEALANQVSQRPPPGSSSSGTASTSTLVAASQKRGRSDTLANTPDIQPPSSTRRRQAAARGSGNDVGANVSLPQTFQFIPYEPPI